RKKGQRWVWEGESGMNRRTGPWRDMLAEGQTSKPPAPPRAQGKRLRDMSLLERATADIRDRATTPADWYDPFRPATWDEALELTAQELNRVHAERGSEAVAVFQSAKCTNEENYLLQRLFRARLGTNN